jgi:hypothetical protein
LVVAAQKHRRALSQLSNFSSPSPPKEGIRAVDLEDEGEGDEDMGEKPRKRLVRKAQMQERNLKKGKVARK